MVPKILLVDDSPSIHALIRVCLKDEPVELTSAFDGNTGLQLAQKMIPDLLLLDVDMPEPDGFDVCERLRDDPMTLNVPVMFLTAAGQVGQKVRGLELGACDYITKPFDLDEVLARIRSALRTKARCDFLAAQRVNNFISTPAVRSTVRQA